MLKKIFLSFMICISMLHNSFFALADTNIQFFDNIDNFKVAHVWIDGLYVRALPDTESKIIDVLNAGQQVEVVAKYPGWAKICLALDSYGFIKDQYFEYRNYTITQPASYINSNEFIYNEVSENYNYDYNNDQNEYEELYTNEEDIYQDASINYSYIQENQEEYNDYTEEQNVEYNDYTEEQNFQYDDYIEEEQNLEYNNDDQIEEEQDIQYAQTIWQDEELMYSSDELSTNSDGSYIVDYAKQYIGNPYVYGGNSLTNGIDCSGFTQQVFGNNGISLARTAAEQSQGGQDVSMDDLQAGDLLFYDNGGYVGHVAIYCGDGTVVHASNEETGITVSDVDYSSVELYFA